MNFEPKYDTVFAQSDVIRRSFASLVECRLTGAGSEVSSILAVHSSAVLTESTARMGEVKYTGKVFVSVVYEDASGSICRAERGAEFMHRAECNECTDESTVYLTLRTKSASFRREGNSVYISVEVCADALVVNTADARYFAGGSSLCLKTADFSAVSVLRENLSFEIEDDFSTENLGDILLHAEHAQIQSVECHRGFVTVRGEVLLQICALKPSGPYSFERLIPFRQEVLSDRITADFTASASLSIASAKISATCDEASNQCSISCLIQADLSVILYEVLPFRPVSDVFCPEYELSCQSKSTRTSLPVGYQTLTERVSGKPECSKTLDFSCNLRAVALQRTEIDAVRTEQGVNAVGVISAAVLYTEADGANKSAAVSLPFSFPLSVQTDASNEVSLSAIVCSLSVKQKREGELELDATLKLSALVYRTESCEYITEIELGAPIKRNQSAISVVIPTAGDDLWTLSKRLRQNPDDVKHLNPDLTFPVPQGERIVIFRRL